MSKEINNLNKPLKDQLELDKKQDKTDNSLATTDKTIVGAINELFQSANNGKQLIANAIGEPLDSNDTFSAMSNEINGLLSTFKTNMMNNGITVEANDRFKSLIDKIATMVEEGSGKGIRIAAGKKSSSSGTRAFYRYANTGYVSLPYLEFSKSEFSFVPNVVVAFRNSTTSSSFYSIYAKINEHSFSCSVTSKNTGNSYAYLRLSDVTDIAYVPVYMNHTSYQYDYIAIGVGEEDTTLRDSLASILENKGVDVTEEDDMASLISKVDEEFDNKENEIDTLQQELEENKVIFEDYFEQMIVCRTLNGYREIDPTSLLIHPEVLISDVSYSSITRCWDGTKNRTFAVKNKILYELDDNMNVIKSSNAKAFYYVAAAYGNGQFKLYAGFIENEDSQVGIVDPESLIVGNSAIGRNGYDTITGMGAAFNKSTSTFEVYYVGDASNSYLFKISEDASTATTINDIAQKTCRGVGVYYDESTQAIRLFTVDNQQGQVLEMSLSWTSGTIINKRMDPYDNEVTNDRPKAVTTWYVKKSRMKYKGQYYYLN